MSDSTVITHCLTLAVVGLENKREMDVSVTKGVMIGVVSLFPKEPKGLVHQLHCPIRILNVYYGNCVVG